MSRSRPDPLPISSQKNRLTMRRMPSATMSRATPIDEVRPRVLRAPIRSYNELGLSAWEEHIAWRERAVARVQSSGGRATSLRRSSAAVDQLAVDLLRIGVWLGESYGTPDLGNKSDPVDELVYIILARRTREGAYQAAYHALKSRYARWEELAEAPTDKVEEVVRFSGLGGRKAQSLKLALGALIERFGRCTLEPTRSWTDQETQDFLCTLPEIGAKSAACVMVCALERPAFPVDAHVGRVLERMEIFRAVGIDLGGVDHKVKQRLLWDAVPPALRYPLHVNLLVHGRAACLPRRPRCSGCPISSDCAHGARASLESSRTG
jgi:endonuclease III